MCHGTNVDTNVDLTSELPVIITTATPSPVTKAKNETTTAIIQTTTLTTKVPITTKVPLTTQPITTKPITTQPITTKPITTQPITTQPITTQHITTQPITTQPITTQHITTQPNTTKVPITTQPTTTILPTTTHRPKLPKKPSSGHWNFTDPSTNETCILIKGGFRFTFSFEKEVIIFIS